MKTVFELPELDIKLEQMGGRNKLLVVTYGAQVSVPLPYSRAANEFGLCVFHALACASKLDNNGK